MCERVGRREKHAYVDRADRSGEIHSETRLINLEIPVLIGSLKSSNVELGSYLDGRLF